MEQVEGRSSAPSFWEQPDPSWHRARHGLAEVNWVSERLKGVACPGACSLMSISLESMQNSREHGDMLIKVIAVR